MDVQKLYGIDRSTNQPFWIAEVVLRGDEVSEFLKFLSETKNGYALPVLSWAKASRIVGLRNGAPEPDIEGCVVELMGVLFGRHWYAVYE
ncbi:MAG: hypothetical protein ACLGXA_25280 [Acidobacteriota bacterium]